MPFGKVDSSSSKDCNPNGFCLNKKQLCFQGGKEEMDVITIQLNAVQLSFANEESKVVLAKLRRISHGIYQH